MKTEPSRRRTPADTQPEFCLAVSGCPKRPLVHFLKAGLAVILIQEGSGQTALRDEQSVVSRKAARDVFNDLTEDDTPKKIVFSGSLFSDQDGNGRAAETGKPEVRIRSFDQKNILTRTQQERTQNFDMINNRCFFEAEEKRPFSEIELFGTLGPSCHERDTLVSMIQSGMNGIRLNLSHGSLKQCEEWIEALHEAEEICGCRLNFLMDLKGRELRIGKMTPTELVEGQIVFLGDEIPASRDILQLIRQGDLIELDDGQIALRALSYDPDQPAWLCEVLAAGLLSSSKSIKIRNRISPFSPLCDQDLENLENAARYGVRSVMVPFVQSRQDLELVRTTLDEYGLSLKIYAKIENRAGMKNLKDFADLADVIVIARGDLGTDTGLYELPAAQAEIEKFCHSHHKDYMVVTQMLTSMVDHPICTRAEANDVFSAIRNGAASVMVTNETAAGSYPVQTMETLYRLTRSGYAYRCREIEEALSAMQKCTD